MTLCHVWLWLGAVPYMKLDICFYMEKNKKKTILRYKLCLKYQNLRVFTEKRFLEADLGV